MGVLMFNASVSSPQKPRASQYGRRFAACLQVTGLLTQGRADGTEWVTSYMVSYSLDAYHWIYITDYYGNRRVSCRVQCCVMLSVINWPKYVYQPVQLGDISWAKNGRNRDVNLDAFW